MREVFSHFCRRSTDVFVLNSKYTLQSKNEATTFYNRTVTVIGKHKQNGSKSSLFAFKEDYLRLPELSQARLTHHYLQFARLESGSGESDRERVAPLARLDH